MSARIFSGTSPVDAWPPDARGMAYGDGVFETMRVHRGSIAWWDSHWDRLQRGARCLRIALPDPAQVRAQAAALFDDGGDGVLKLLLSRGGSGRGYAPSTTAAPLWMVSRHALPQPAADGLRVGWCTTLCASQPALAGIKHCNRLEQVLARAEVVDAGLDEGLMRDGDGNIISATAANLFIVRGGQWITPRLDTCGVAGVCRARLLPLLGAVEARLSARDIDGADAVFLCNAVRGILAVAQVGARARASHAAVAGARVQLARIHPAFAIDVEHS